MHAKYIAGKLFDQFSHNCVIEARLMIDYWQIDEKLSFLYLLRKYHLFLYYYIYIFFKFNLGHIWILQEYFLAFVCFLSHFSNPMCLVAEYFAVFLTNMPEFYL